MIGELEFKQGDRTVHATLDSSLMWHCEDTVLEEVLNATCAGSLWGADDTRDHGVHCLYRAATRLGATVAVYAEGAVDSRLQAVD